MKKELTQKEKLFCRLFAQTLDARQSASRAGYRLNPDKAAIKLLSRDEINEQISQFSQQSSFVDAGARKGYNRLAFGSAADAVKLMLFAERMTPEEIETLDLFNVSEIKIGKGGTVEIRFFDRLKALDKLGESETARQTTPDDLLLALENGAAQISRGTE